MNEKQKELSPKEQYDLKKKEKGQLKKKEQVREKISEAPKKIGKYLLYTLITVAVLGGTVFAVSRLPNLPPTTAQNHSESSPRSHISNTPIPDGVQRHMLEHADGDDGNGQGIIIQYNCDDYECEAEMVEQLTNLVIQYPDNVYLAPNNYDGKIILTKLSRREILEEFDGQIIRNFIQ